MIPALVFYLASMSATASCISARLPGCLTSLVLGYFGQSKNLYEMTVLGQYEDCCIMSVTPMMNHDMFCCACNFDQLEIVKLAISRGAIELGYGISLACKGRNINIVSDIHGRQSFILGHWAMVRGIGILDWKTRVKEAMLRLPR